ncbi:MAG: family 43 glycosylhydrolase [Bacteroidales bacterium]|nr:family 43 glycosylhydrolase [Bacteroidales bacterium]
MKAESDIKKTGYFRHCAFLLSLILYISAGPMYALHNQYELHDPSSIIKCGDNYWIFATGNGIHSLYSKDLVGWTNGENPFAWGSYPSWVLNYVPDFTGHYWAPECFYMNGLYYLYYSCSSWGSRNSCIGLLTSKSLNPGSDDYAWKDEGMVVYSTDAGDVNCIDPAVFRDDEGKIWLTYGSHWDGIRIIELDSLTGKVIGGTHHPVAGKGDYKTEAPYVINHGEFYYLFFNRGQCCDGVNSTYYIQVGRSTSPTGPFLDKSGKDCYQGGGSTVLITSGSFIGPGCIGYYVENKTEFVTYHYYDGANSGRATLNIGTVKWDDNDWPVFTNNWIEDGHYSLKNVNSQLAWDFSGAGEDQDPVVQNAYSQEGSQKWTFEALGNGFYSISPGGRDLVAMLKDCFGGTGTKINLGIPESKSCQIWRVEKTGDLNFMFSSKYGNRVLEVPGASAEAGIQFTGDLYSGGANQRWALPDTFQYVSVQDKTFSQQWVNLYPNPVAGEQFYIDFRQNEPVGECEIEILSSDGKVVFSKSYFSPQVVTIHKRFEPQIYFVSIKSKNNSFFHKLVVQ